MKRLLFIFLLITCYAHAQWVATMNPGTDGNVQADGKEIAKFLPGLHEAPNWHRRDFKTLNVEKLGIDGAVHGQIVTADGKYFSDVMAAKRDTRTIRFQCSLSSDHDVALNSLHVAFMVSTDILIGKSWSVDDQPFRPYPLEFARKTKHQFDGIIRKMTLETTLGPIVFSFPEPTYVLLQDNRNWGDNFEVRVNYSPTVQKGSFDWRKEDRFDVAVDMVLPVETTLNKSEPVTIEEGADWVKVDLRTGVRKGSAVDFSDVINRHAPAGKFGRVVAKGENFEFEGLPGVPQKFYGVNLVGGANTPPTHEQAVELAERLYRLGYNTVRFHHYGNAIYSRKAAHSYEIDEARLERLDFLFAELKKRGIYVTTDVYSSRVVKAADIFDGMEGNLSFQEFRQVLPFSEKAMNHWKLFAKAFFLHLNPYTGMTYAEDPAMPWICLVNEGNFYRVMPGPLMSKNTVELWVKAWNEWTLKKYGDFQKRNKAWETPDKAEFLEDMSTGGSVACQRDFFEFTFEIERQMYAEMRDFMQNELGCKAMLTNLNHSGFAPSEMLSRMDFDYVDQHFYVDHPRFLTPVRWALPLSINNDNVVKTGGFGGTLQALTRLYDRPFTVTEFNYSYPGEHRGVGGILTGCLGAIQNWAGIWRFAYSHGGINIYKPMGMRHFDLASDPLNQAADRATICLYLRGDLQPVSHSIAVTLPSDYLSCVPPKEQVTRVSPAWQRFAMITKLGCAFGDNTTKVPVDLSLGLASNAPQGRRHLVGDVLGQEGLTALTKAIADGKWLPDGNKSDLRDGIRRLQTASRQFDIDFMNGCFTLDTAMTAGGYAEGGGIITTQAGVDISIIDTPATVWASSLDGRPLASSGRILLTHLTDVQNSGIRFAEKERKTQLSWGDLPLLARTGKAVVTLKRDKNAPLLRAWAIAMDGERLFKLSFKVDKDSCIHLPLDVRGPEGARMLYELERVE